MSWIVGKPTVSIYPQATGTSRENSLVQIQLYLTALFTLVTVHHHRVIGAQESGTAAAGPALAEGVHALTGSFQERLRKPHRLIARGDVLNDWPLGQMVSCWRHWIYPPVG
jgi:hypothetical protein